MMKKKIDKETRFYLDIDIKTLKVLGWDYDQRDILASNMPTIPTLRRIFITKGQYNKLTKR